MDKDRKILLKILAVTAVIPAILFLSLSVSEIREKRELLSRFRSETGSLPAVQREVFQLEEERSLLTTAEKERDTLYFSPDEITYYQFCDFIVNSARNRGLSIKDYTTDEGGTPQRIVLRAEGSVGNLLTFLHHLHTMEKEIDIPRTAISLNSSKGVYEISLTADFITKAAEPKEPNR